MTKCFREQSNPNNRTDSIDRTNKLEYLSTRVSINRQERGVVKAEQRETMREMTCQGHKERR